MDWTTNSVFTGLLGGKHDFHKLHRMGLYELFVCAACNVDEKRVRICTDNPGRYRAAIKKYGLRGIQIKTVRTGWRFGYMVTIRPTVLLSGLEKLAVKDML